MHGRRPASTVLAGYQRRFLRLLSMEQFDAVICEQEAFPYLPIVFERVLRRKAPKLFFDYDDAAYVRYDKCPGLRNKLSYVMGSRRGRCRQPKSRDVC